MDDDGRAAQDWQSLPVHVLLRLIEAAASGNPDFQRHVQRQARLVCKPWCQVLDAASVSITLPRFAVDRLPRFPHLTALTVQGIERKGPKPKGNLISTEVDDDEDLHATAAEAQLSLQLYMQLGPTLPPLAATLQVLSLQHCGLVELPVSVAALSCLNTLRLKGNKLTSVPDFLVPPLMPPTFAAHLTHLDLSANCLSQLPPGLTHLTALVTLDLCENQLDQAPVGNLEILGSFPALTDLDLAVNRLAEVPLALTRLTQLAVLGLDDSRLMCIPRWIGCLTSLQHLFLRQCFDRDQVFAVLVRDELELLAPLTGLEALDVGRNGLMKLPHSIRGMTRLVNLNLSGSHFSKLPPQMWDLTDLQNLNLSDCGLGSLSADISRLESLSVLDVQGSTFQELPPELLLCTALEELRVDEEVVARVSDRSVLKALLQAGMEVLQVGYDEDGRVEDAELLEDPDFLELMEQLPQDPGQARLKELLQMMKVWDDEYGGDDSSAEDEIVEDNEDEV